MNLTFKRKPKMIDSVRSIRRKRRSRRMRLRFFLLRKIVWWDGFTRGKLEYGKRDTASVKGRRVETTTLQKKDWTLLAIALAEGKPLSPVQLQKSVFLFGKLLPDEVLPEDFYEFVPYNYGPFCPEVYRDAEELAEEELVQISSVSAHGYSQYSATPEGIEEGRRLVELLPYRVAEHARVIVEWVRAQTFRALVSAIYERFPEYRANSVFTG
jgi:hypothetical protein